MAESILIIIIILFSIGLITYIRASALNDKELSNDKLPSKNDAPSSPSETGLTD